VAREAKELKGRMVKLSGNRLRLRSGAIRQFKSAQARENFERVATAVRENPEFAKKLKKNQRLGRA